jgi:hypothetical protein
MSNPKGADFVLETSTTLGQGDMLLDGTPNAKFQRWRDVFADGAEIFYGIAQDAGGSEVGWGTLVYGTPDRIVRTKVEASTNGGAAVDWGEGDKVVFATYPSARANEWGRVVEVTLTDNTPFPIPATGQQFLVGSSPSGAWAGKAHQWATWDGAAWAFEVPEVGEITQEIASPTVNKTYIFDGTLQILVAVNSLTADSSGAIQITSALTVFNDLFADRTVAGGPATAQVLNRGTAAASRARLHLKASSAVGVASGEVGGPEILLDNGGVLWVIGLDADDGDVLKIAEGGNVRSGTVRVKMWSGGGVEVDGLTIFGRLASAPTAKASGDVYYDTTANKLRVWTGAAWVDLH